MTTDDITRLAREAGWKDLPTVRLAFAGFDLERFAKLAYEAAAAAERNRMIADGWRQCAQGQKTSQFCGMVERARLEEREACAKLCDKPGTAPRTSGWVLGPNVALTGARADDRKCKDAERRPVERPVGPVSGA